MELDQKQVQAVERCCDIKERIVPITGKAGTGKTTLMQRVYELMTENGYKVALCAPTGKAAKRIEEATGIKAMTLHRLLEYTHPGEPDPDTGEVATFSYPRRTKQRPLAFDVILADEYAMVNHELHRNLIFALPSGGVVRMFGDVNQLPPIEPNKKLRLMNSPFQEAIKRFKGVVLEKIHRQEEESGVRFNAERILRMDMPKERDDFQITITENPVDVLQQIVREYKEKGMDFSHTDFQVISPTKKGWIGTAKVNPILQNVYRPIGTKWITLPRNKWAPDQDTRACVGDKVVWTQNNYDLELFNGETGIITHFEPDGAVTVDWGDKVTTVPVMQRVITKRGTFATIDPRKDMDLAYVMTTHKSQGSEYKGVIYLINKSAAFVLARPNFYTAVTRASEFVHVITDKTGLVYSLQRTESRATTMEKKGA